MPDEIRVCETCRRQVMGKGDQQDWKAIGDDDANLYWYCKNQPCQIAYQARLDQMILELNPEEAEERAVTKEETDFGRCVTCNDYVDDKGFCVRNLAHKSGYRACPVCGGKVDGMDRCNGCNDWGIVKVAGS